MRYGLLVVERRVDSYTLSSSSLTGEEEGEERGPIIVHLSVAVPERLPASLVVVGTRHSSVSLPGLKCASPRLGRRSVRFRREGEMGTVTTISSMVGALELELEPPPRNDGVDAPEARPGNPLLDGRPGKLVFKVSRTSNSAPVGPSDLCRSTVAGRNSFSIWLGGLSSSGSMGCRSTSYPARTKRPSGGTKLSSPGFSLHRARRTQGWNTGS